MEYHPRKAMNSCELKPAGQNQSEEMGSDKIQAHSGPDMGSHKFQAGLPSVRKPFLDLPCCHTC